MYYREFEGLDEIRRGSFVELSGRLLQKNRSDSAAFSRQPSDRYVSSYMNAGVTDPIEIACDCKRISFVSKANDIFQCSIFPKNCRSEPTIKKIANMEKQRKISTQTSGAWPPIYYQPVDPPHFEQADPVSLLQTRREAELESAVKILSMKLEYTQRKIMESQNNKEILKAKLDFLIDNLTKAGYDPNFRALPTDPRLPSRVKTLLTKLYYTQRKVMESQNNQEILKTKMDNLIDNLTKLGYDPNWKFSEILKNLSVFNNRPASGPNELRRPPQTNERGVKYSPRMAQKGAEQYRETPMHPGQMQTYRPVVPDHRKLGNNTSLEKLKELADEYERRLMMVKSLEEQEKYVKSQMTTPVNITVPSIMGAPRQNTEHQR